MAYASRTDVPVDRSRAEIERLVTKFGATTFATAIEQGRAVVMFEAHSRRIRFDLPLPESSPKHDQLRRSRWRALLLVIKAKLESVESKIETFEEAFLAHVVMPDGVTIGQHAKPSIARAYSENRMVPLLPGPK
jgi:hypothetical protein